MTDLIFESADIAEIDGICQDEYSDISDMSATKSADPTTMDFHIQMRGYTMRDFEGMVVNAAAQQLVGGRCFQKEIQDKAVGIANAKVNDQLTIAMRDIMGLAVQSRGKEAVTLGQMIGMEAKDYLTQPVNSRGEFDTSGYHSGGRQPRAAYLVSEYVKAHFAKEIKTAMDAMIAEMKPKIIAELDVTIKAERERMAKALSHVVQARR